MSEGGSFFHCKACQVSMTGYQQKLQHQAGKKHLAKIKQSIKSVLDDKPVTTEASSDQAYGGRFVAASQSKIDKQFGTEGQFKGGNDPVGEAIRQNLLGTLSKKRKAMVIGTCEPCGVDFNSEDQKTAHLTGKKHMKKIKLSIGGFNPVFGDLNQYKIVVSLFGAAYAAPNKGSSGEPQTFHCPYCNLTVNSAEQLDQHQAGSKHVKKVLDYNRMYGVEGAATKVEQTLDPRKVKPPQTSDPWIVNTTQTSDTRKVNPPQTSDPWKVNPAPPVLPASGLPLPPAQLEAMKNSKS